MPLLKGSASDFTAVVKGSAEVNASVGGAVARGGSSVRTLGGGLVAIVTQSAIAKVSGFQPLQFRATVASAPTPTPAPAPAPVVETSAQPLSSYRGSQDAFIVKYNSVGKAVWSAKIGSTGSEIGYSVCVDSSGNIYVCGQNGNAEVLLFNADGTFSGIRIANNGNGDAFIAKYSSSGIAQWGARVVSTSQDIAYSIAVDSSGNSYITGQSFSTITAFNANGTSFATTLTSAGAEDAFIVKYNTAGSVQWLTRIASTGSDIGFSIATDRSGNLYVAGQGGSGAVATAYNSDSTSFATTIDNAGSTDGFIVKYNPSGFVQWFARIGSSGADIAYAITTDSAGNVYVAGQGGSGATITAYNFDKSAFATTISNAGGNDVFVAKYNSTGTVQWLTRIASSGNDIGYGITCDSAANVYVCGAGGNGTITAYSSVGATPFTPTLTNVGNGDAFLVKFNTNGVVQWVSKVGSTAADIAYAIAVDSTDSVYITGQGGSNVTVKAYNFDESEFGTSISNLGGNDVFLVKYNSTGTVQWMTRLATNTNDSGRSLAIDSSNNICLAGQFTGTSNSIYGQSTSLFSVIPNSGDMDVFIVKYNTNGAPQWTARIISAGGSLDRGWAVASDSDGNVYATSQVPGVITAYNADGTPFATTLTSIGSFEVVLVKYNSSGVIQWITRIASNNDDAGYGISTDSSGNIYITGHFIGSSMIAYNADGSQLATTLPITGDYDAFIAKYNTNGIAQWIARIASGGADKGLGITTDASGNVYATGLCAGSSGTTISAYSSTTPSTPFATTITNVGAGDAFVVKFNSSGIVQWLTQIASTTQDLGYSIAADASGNVYVGGLKNSGTGSITAYNFDGSPFATTLSNLGGNESFLVKYNTTGTVQWITRVVGTNGIEQTSGVAVDSSGNVYVCGNMPYSGTATFLYNSDGSQSTSVSLVLSWVFIAKYNSSGFVQWAAGVESINGSGSLSGIALDASANVYVVGIFAGSNVYVKDKNGEIFSEIADTTSVIKYNSDGMPQWAQLVRSTQLASVTQNRGICADPLGNVSIIGNSASGSTVQVYGVDRTLYKVINSIGSSSAFLVKYSSNTTPLWVARIASTGADLAYSVCTDLSGNVYITGQTGADVSAVAYNSDETPFATTITNSGGSDAFIVKYNSSGFVQWVARIASTGTDIGYSCTCDPSGNVIVIGQGGNNAAVSAFSSTGVAFARTLSNTANATDVFLVKYNSEGIVQWVARMVSSGTDIGYDVSTDSSGNIYATGQTSASMTAYDASDNPFTRTTGYSGGTDAFLIKYTPTGGVEWVARIGAGYNDVGYSTAVDPSGNVIITGTMWGQGGNVTAINSDGTSFATTIPNVRLEDCFVVKYNSSGFVQWVARMTSSENDRPNSIATDSSGNIYVCGSAYDQVTVTGSDLAQISSSTYGGFGIDAFVTKFNAAGVAQWIARLANLSVPGSAFGLVVDSSSNVYVTGKTAYNNILAYNANGTVFGTATTRSLPDSEMFTVKYDTNGFVQWISQMTSIGNDEARSLAIDTSNNLYLAGTIVSSALLPSNA